MKVFVRTVKAFLFFACAALVSSCVMPAPASAAEVVKAYTTMEEPLAKTLFDEFEKTTGIKWNG